MLIDFWLNITETEIQISVISAHLDQSSMAFITSKKPSSWILFSLRSFLMYLAIVSVSCWSFNLIAPQCFLGVNDTSRAFYLKLEPPQRMLGIEMTFEVEAR